MPELPEVETMRRGLEKIVGLRIHSVSFPAAKRLRSLLFKPSPQRLKTRLLSLVITGIRRIGKRIVIDFNSDESLVIEPRMTGLLLLANSPSPEHNRVEICFDDSSIHPLIYWDRRGLGTVQLLSVHTMSLLFNSNRIGPDALLITAEDLRCRLGRSRRPVKVALLDQRGLSGIGNIYASEILFRAQIHPRALCNRLLPQAWGRLHESIQSVLREAIQLKGSTLSDATYRTPQNRSGGFQFHHHVYGKQGTSCFVCGNPIERFVQAQRATFACPTCQNMRFLRKL